MTRSLGRLLVLVTVMSAKAVAAQELASSPRDIPLYPGPAPGSEAWDWSERSFTATGGVPAVQNVVRPVLQYYPADKAKATGTAVIIVPGGGWRILMIGYEGADIAARLNAEGVDAFVLKHRLAYVSPNPQPAPAVPALPAAEVRQMANADAQQAMRLVRQRASEFGVRPDRVGMIGFSSGGAVMLTTVTGPVDARPDFAVSIYALGAGSYAPPEGAPPLFIAVASDDIIVGYQGSLDLYSAWRKARLPVELHVYQTGQHGFLKKGGGADHFMDRAVEWMKLNGLTRP